MGKEILSIEEIFNGLGKHLSELEPRIKELEKMVKDYREKLNAAETELKVLNNKYEGIRMSKESLELLDGISSEMKEDKSKEVKAEEVKPVASEPKASEPDKKNAKPKLMKWTTKDARLIQLDRNDRVIGNFPTQKAAARALGWDQSAISRFMKFERNTQINKKNFYFKWEY